MTSDLVGAEDHNSKMTGCIVMGCSMEKHYSRGMCKRHYTEWWKGREVPGGPPIRQVPSCSQAECNAAVLSRNLCRGHYNALMKTAPPKLKERGRLCDVKGCGRPHESQGLCGTHALRRKKGQDLTIAVRTDRSLQQRLDFYGPPSEPSECWLWTGARTNGYGVLNVDGILRRATHVALELATGEHVPDGLVVRHRCDKPACINPSHLETGTQADNVNDMHARGRAAVGAALPVSKVTPGIVRQIRDLYGSGTVTQASIAKQFNVTQPTVWAIINRKTWRHVN